MKRSRRRTAEPHGDGPLSHRENELRQGRTNKKDERTESGDPVLFCVQGNRKIRNPHNGAEDYATGILPAPCNAV